MQVGVIGISHEKAPVEIREKVAFTDKQKIQVSNALMEEVEEVVILSTCNRSEVYLVAKDIKQGLAKVKAYLQSYFQGTFEAYFFELSHKEAIEHLIKVTAGLDSLILGEDQILGQVKEAFEFALDIGSSKKFLNKIFREAITYAKKMRSRYRISEHPLSLAYLGVKLIKAKVPDLRNKKVMVVGTGEMGQLVLKYLKEAGVKEIYVANRSETRCKKQAIEAVIPEVHWSTYEGRYEQVLDMDVLFSATSSPHRIFKEAYYPQVTREQWIIDLAIPRDVDKSIGHRKQIQLYNIDDLKEMANENIKKRQALANKIEDGIDEKVHEINQWMMQTKLDPILQSLNHLKDEVARDTMDLIDKKLELNTRERVFLEELIHSALKRMVRTPIKALKALEDKEEIESYKKMFEHLFGE